ncbi:O-methylsterigmatocystin oxidoreductase [Trametes polyzona]|nr:O-methylsterigmatocystin oxidoreductase [Trametes polyzona]
MSAVARYTIYPTDWLALIATLVVLVLIRNRTRRPLPPGPPKIPFVGNAFGIPQNQAWLAYRDMAKQYGDVIALQAFGQTVIVLSSMTAAVDLLEKRSAIYSDRPDSMAIKLIGWDWNLALKRYGNEWRRARRLFWRHFQPNMVPKYHSAQQREARRFLRHLLDGQNDIDGRIKLSLTKTILSSVHGIPAEEATRYYVEILTRSEAGIAEAFTQGALLVDFLPWLRHIPSWVPGTGWKRKIAVWRTEALTILDYPFEAALDAKRRGVMHTSVLSEILEDKPHIDGSQKDEDSKVIKEITSAAFGGKAFLLIGLSKSYTNATSPSPAGTDTTAATLVAFFCAMLLHPEVQTRAQFELDTVIGPDRLPEHADRPSLPYIIAIVKELLRWHIVAPLGVAHRCIEEDEYRGWRIPKGSVIIPAAWAMLHDPDVFPEPEVFRPERFLKDGELDQDTAYPEAITFGFGRRVCPGRHFASDALFISIACTLHAFTIQPALDEHGHPVPVEAKMTSGFLSYVEEFEYSIRPRSDAAEALLRASAGEGVLSGSSSF